MQAYHAISALFETTNLTTEWAAPQTKETVLLISRAIKWFHTSYNETIGLIFRSKVPVYTEKWRISKKSYMAVLHVAFKNHATTWCELVYFYKIISNTVFKHKRWIIWKSKLCCDSHCSVPREKFFIYLRRVRSRKQELVLLKYGKNLQTWTALMNEPISFHIFWVRHPCKNWSILMWSNVPHRLNFQGICWKYKEEASTLQGRSENFYQLEVARVVPIGK